jgi:hypothetical protein
LIIGKPNNPCEGREHDQSDDNEEGGARALFLRILIGQVVDRYLVRQRLIDSALEVVHGPNSAES